MQIFSDTSKFLCAEDYPTIQYVVPVYNYLLEKIKEFKSITPAYMNPAVKHAYDKILSYYDLTGQRGPLNEVYAAAILLDPTLKMQFFKDRNWTSNAMKSVRDKVRNIYIARSSEQADQNSAEDSNDQENTNPLIAQLYKRRKVDKRSEFDQFLALPVIPFESNGVACNKLSWWQVS